MALDEDPSRLEYPPACNNLFTASSYFYFQELCLLLALTLTDDSYAENDVRL